MRRMVWILLWMMMGACVPLVGQEVEKPTSVVRFNQNFEGASIGKIEAVGPDAYRMHVLGQCDDRGRNRQASWYAFRIDGAKGRKLSLTLTDFVGEYNDKPGACPMGPDIVPVWSTDGKVWKPFEGDGCVWDGQAKELTLRVEGGQTESVWVAHIPPYTPADLKALLEEVGKSPHAVVEVIGKTLGGREMHLVTVTDAQVSDAEKKVIWLQARQHAWEAGTSQAMEGALRFITSDDAAAAKLRREVIFKFTPMVDVDGCAAGRVRFNGNGFDVNRHWDEVDLRDKKWLALMPEIWYTKKAILAQHASKPIDLLLNLHNTETSEYTDTMVEDEAVLKVMRKFEETLVAGDGFDPSRRLVVSKTPGNTTNALWVEKRVPVMLMELRIGTSKKLGRRPTAEDRRKLGREMVEAMAGAVR